MGDPGAWGDCSAFPFRATAAGMWSAPLVGHQVVQMGQPAQDCLLAALRRLDAFHHAQLPVDGVMHLSEQGARHRHLGVGEDRIPARRLVLKPASHARAVGRPRRGGDGVGNVASPLAEREHPHALARSRPIEQGVERRAQGLADRGRARRPLLRELMDGMAPAVAEACPREQRPHTPGRTIAALGEDPPDPIRGVLLGRRALERLIRRRQGEGTCVRGVAQRPAHPATDDRGQRHLVSETAAVLFIHQEIPGPRQTTSCQHRSQTLGAECTDQAIQGHR
jgi:hypothetical protein